MLQATETMLIHEMTNEEFAAIRAAAGMTYKQVAKYLRVNIRSVMRYESGERSIIGPVAVLMEMLKEKTRKKATKGRT